MANDASTPPDADEMAQLGGVDGGAAGAAAGAGQHCHLPGAAATTCAAVGWCLGGALLPGAVGGCGTCSALLVRRWGGQGLRLQPANSCRGLWVGSSVGTAQLGVTQPTGVAGGQRRGCMPGASTVRRSLHMQVQQQMRKQT